MTQKEHISLLQNRCQKLGITISENMVWNLNPGVNAPEFIEKTSQQWIEFVDDVETYFSIYKDERLASEAKNLLNQPFIGSDWIGEMQAFLHRLENKLLLKEAEGSNLSAKETQTNKGTVTRVFIVHGHDNEAVQTVARFLEKLGFEAIILREQANKGKIIFEKIEEYSDVDFAIVLYTPCDVGRVKDDPSAIEKPRARQNVVFEHGYLMKKLGRDRICALVKDGVETPGDISGFVYVKMTDGESWKYEVCREMRSAGLNVDLNRI